MVDTLSRAIAGGNENAPEDMTAFVKTVGHLQQSLSAHVSVVHHSGKDGARGARGHSSLRAATDTEIEVTRDNSAGVSVAKVTKQRDMELAGEFAFRLETVELGHNRRGKPVVSCVVHEADTPTSDRGLSKDEQSALNVLFDLITKSGARGFPGVPDSLLSVCEASWREAFYSRSKPGASPGAKQKAFRRAADALLAAGRVGFEGERIWLPDGTRPDKTGHVPLGL